MAIIDPLAGFFPFRKPEKKKPKERAELLKFSAKLESIQQREEELAAELNGEAEYKGNLEDLLDWVHEQGERLKELPTVENVKKYRKAVSSFLKYAFARMFSVERNISGVNICPAPSPDFGPSPAGPDGGLAGVPMVNAFSSIFSKLVKRSLRSPAFTN